MSRNSSKAALAALLTLPLLAPAPAAFAQEAIMLEQIGAVRMATPTEIQHGTETLWFADAEASAYYTLDQDRHEVVARFEAGPKGGSARVVHRTIEDGAVERFTVDGTGSNRIRSTLVVSRLGSKLTATVQTAKTVEQASAGEPEASTRPVFYVPAVVGAAFTDRRIATNPEDVRRQGGFATAGTVLWLPAAPADAQAASEKTLKVGAL